MTREEAKEQIKKDLQQKLNEAQWPRIRDLPPDEQAPFREFLTGQTLPLLDGVPMEEQDGYYPWDYDNWKRKPKDRFFD